MQYKLLTEEDVLKASLGQDAHFTITEKAKRTFRGIKKLSVLRKLRNAAKSMKEIKEGYHSYPTSSKDFETWKAHAKRRFEEAFLKLEE